MAGWRQDKNIKNISVNLNLAKERLEQIAFLGLQDRFHESLEVFSYQFGTAQISSYPELNKTDNSLRKEGLPEAIADQLAQMNRMDIELCEYGKKIFNQRLEEINSEFLKIRPVDNNYTIRDWIRTENWPEKAKTRNLFFKFETLISMSGWHNTDFSSDKISWTWSGPGVESVIDFPLDRSGDLQMNILIHDAMTSDILDNLKIEIDDHPLLFSRSIKNKAHLLRAIVNADPLKPSYTYTSIKFTINRTIRPSEVNQASNDNRLLGFALQSIEFKQTNNLRITTIKLFKHHLYKLREIFRGKTKIIL